MARWLIWVGVMLAVLTAPAVGQEPTAERFAWSPLRPTADLAREARLRLAIPDLILTPWMPAGSFWLSGNPGALVFDLDSFGWSAFWVDGRLERGALRRPADPARSERFAVAAAGWGRPAERVAVIGRATVERWIDDTAGFAVMLDPYGSNPLVYTDTTSPTRVLTGARLEGASAWRVGRWGFGGALGYRAADYRAQHTPVPRIVRRSEPAVAAGATRTLGPVRIGVHGKWRRRLEQATVLPRAAFVTVYQLEGYADPTGLSLIELPHGRRTELDELALGFAFDGRLDGVTWALSAQRAFANEVQFRARTAEVPQDHWTAAVTELAFLAHIRLGERVATRGTAQWRDLSGEAALGRFDDAVVFRADESRLALEGELRAGGSGWQAAIVVGTSRNAFTRSDFILDRAVSVVSWSPHASLSGAFSIRPQTAIELGLAGAARSPVATILDPVNRTAAWRRLVAPELGLLATRLRGVAARAAISYQIRGGVIWTGVTATRETPWTDAPLPFAPQGRRDHLHVAAGVRLGG